MRLSMPAQRRLFGLAAGTTALLTAAWVWSPGLPVWWGPTARAADVAAGRDLFEHQWTANDPLAHGDGLGPVFNATSCAACHFQGGVGGGGGVAHNAVNYEVLPRPGDPALHVGTVHAFSVRPGDKESAAALRKAFPVARGQAPPPAPGMEGCPTLGPGAAPAVPDFDPVRIESVQATALFGAGWVDLISEKAILANARDRAIRATVQELSLDFGQVAAGRVRVLPDGRVGKFGWRAQFATLGEFVATACANEIGLGTAAVPEARPLTSMASTASGPADLDKTQVRQLTAFVKMLPRPVEVTPDSSAAAATATRGKELFRSVGCATCHVPDLGGVTGVYSDFLLYVLDDPAPPGGGGGGYGPEPPPERPRPADLPRPEEWKTPPLWGVADSAPYLHDGSAPTLAAAIARHRGEAKPVTAAFAALTRDDQDAVIAFLRTLKAPPTAAPLRDPAVTKLAKR